MALQEKKSKMPPAEDGGVPKPKKDKTKQKDIKIAPHILKVLKQVNKKVTISKQAMAIMESCVNDTFDRLTTEASSILRHSPKSKDTLTSREMQTAVRFVFPSELARHAISEGCKALMNYNTTKKGQEQAEE
mmetsp:Transcript_57330/g.136265  ORF Transcript_57330/g.136265 Transcript_57330/m.136265 type:complete len:132 (+) Transcript_57330:88-483(+)|eukprot:CAMPEP_0178422748 /NCGR_PEP_ID=MMETSP0689_2-20121128/27334_1 /TAXON_ID=160604 /ORGANISM="Amphidinium massartii, Strain CS-259" /LENGTH=131 /DNA_ID=CAMNT_0020044323 /DNA_START=100 /DNA_END=495 /DNA_ORIENTATION=-